MISWILLDLGMVQGSPWAWYDQPADEARSSLAWALIRRQARVASLSPLTASDLVQQTNEFLQAQNPQKHKSSSRELAYLESA